MTPERVVVPTKTAQIVEAVQQARAHGARIRAVGSGHSFTPAAMTDGTLVCLERFTGLVAVDSTTREVTIRAGTPLHVLNDALADLGLALPNLGDIDRQTIAGAISTGTHGTGVKLGGLASLVTGLELVTGTGEVLRCSPHQHPEIFAAARVSLGALGIITEVTLQCVDAFNLRAEEGPVPLERAVAHLTDPNPADEHAEFYWFPYTDRALLKRNNRVPPGDPFRPLSRWRGWWEDEFLSNTVLGMACRLGRAVPRLVPMLSSVAARALSARTFTARSDRVFCSPRRVRFVEMEYAVPLEALSEAFAGIQRAVQTCGIPVTFPVEVRTAAADDIWLSTAYQRDSAYLAVHQFVGMAYEPYFRAVEAEMSRLGGRPHWGKLHYLSAAELVHRYPRFTDFLALRDQLDPDRVFANPYLTHVLGP